MRNRVYWGEVAVLWGSMGRWLCLINPEIWLISLLFHSLDNLFLQSDDEFVVVT
jgi:hypothetical protein